MLLMMSACLVSTGYIEALNSKNGLILPEILRSHIRKITEKLRGKKNYEYTVIFLTLLNSTD